MSTNRSIMESTGARKTGRPHAPASTAGRRLAGSKTKADNTPEAKADATPVEPADRYQLIAEAAYFIAQRRGFAPGSELEDWIQAEAEVARRFGEITAE